MNNESQSATTETIQVDSIETLQAALDSGMTLRDVVPLRFRKIFKKCFWSVVIICSVWALASIWVWDWLVRQDDVSKLAKGWAMWVGVLLLLLVWRTGYQLLYYITYHYNANQRGIVIRKGVLAKTEITLPFSKITDVYIEQDILDVLFGLYDLHISTPTVTSGQLAHIDGIDKEGAHLVRAYVLSRIHEESQPESDREESQKLA